MSESSSWLPGFDGALRGYVESREGRYGGCLSSGSSRDARRGPGAGAGEGPDGRGERQAAGNGEGCSMKLSGASAGLGRDGSECGPT